MGVDGALGQAAVDWVSDLSSSTSLDGSIQLQEGRELRVTLNTPEDVMDIISVRLVCLFKCIIWAKIYLKNVLCRNCAHFSLFTTDHVGINCNTSQKLYEYEHSMYYFALRFPEECVCNFSFHQLQSVSAQWRPQRGDKGAKESSPEDHLYTKDL